MNASRNMLALLLSELGGGRLPAFRRGARGEKNVFQFDDGVIRAGIGAESGGLAAPLSRVVSGGPGPIP